MKRTIFLSLVLSGMVVPSHAVKRVTVAQLEHLVTSLHGKPDGDQAYQISDLELTERLSTERIARLGAALPGEKTRQALTAIAAVSQFHAPPADEVPSTAVPDVAAQRRIMGLVANYVTKTIPQLPNFLATRATTRFEDTPLLQKPDGFIPYEPLHQVGTSSATVLYRDGHEVEDQAKRSRRRPRMDSLPRENSAQSWASFFSTPRRASSPGAIGNREPAAWRLSSATRCKKKNRTTR